MRHGYILPSWELTYPTYGRTSFSQLPLNGIMLVCRRVGVGFRDGDLHLFLMKPSTDQVPGALRSTDKVGLHQYMVVLRICIIDIHFIYCIYISVAHVCFHQTHSLHCRHCPFARLYSRSDAALNLSGSSIHSSPWQQHNWLQKPHKVIMVGFLYGEIPSSMRYMFQVFPHGMVQLHTNFLEYNLVIF